MPLPPALEKYVELFYEWHARESAALFTLILKGSITREHTRIEEIVMCLLEEGYPQERIGAILWSAYNRRTKSTCSTPPEPFSRKVLIKTNKKTIPYSEFKRIPQTDTRTTLRESVFRIIAPGGPKTGEGISNPSVWDLTLDMDESITNPQLPQPKTGETRGQGRRQRSRSKGKKKNTTSHQNRLTRKQKNVNIPGGGPPPEKTQT